MTVPVIQIAAVVASTKTPVSARVEIKSNRPVPTPEKGEILVKLEFSGVCHSDVHSIRGDTPMLTDVAGHEGVGQVVKGTIDIRIWEHSAELLTHYSGFQLDQELTKRNGWEPGLVSGLYLLHSVKSSNLRYRSWILTLSQFGRLGGSIALVVSARFVR